MFVVVTILSIGLGWTVSSLDWVQRRREAFLTKDGLYGNQRVPSLFESPMAPSGLWLFGERGQAVLRINTQITSKTEILEIRSLFPEATLWLRSGLKRREEDIDLAPGEYPPKVD